MIFGFVTISLAISGYELVGIGTKDPIGIKQRNEINLKEELLSYRMDTICGAVNDKWDYGRTYEMKSQNSCSKVCAATDEDTKACVGLIIQNAENTHIARHDCNHIPTPNYFERGDRTFCCCR